MVIDVVDGADDFWIRKRALEPFNNGFWMVFDASMTLSEDTEWQDRFYGADSNNVEAARSFSVALFRNVFQELGVEEVPVLKLSCHKVSEMLTMV